MINKNIWRSIVMFAFIVVSLFGGGILAAQNNDNIKTINSDVIIHRTGSGSDKQVVATFTYDYNLKTKSVVTDSLKWVNIGSHPHFDISKIMLSVTGHGKYIVVSNIVPSSGVNVYQETKMIKAGSDDNWNLHYKLKDVPSNEVEEQKEFPVYEGLNLGGVYSTDSINLSKIASVKVDVMKNLDTGLYTIIKGRSPLVIVNPQLGHVESKYIDVNSIIASSGDNNVLRIDNNSVNAKSGYVINNIYDNSFDINDSNALQAFVLNVNNITPPPPADYSGSVVVKYNGFEVQVANIIYAIDKDKNVSSLKFDHLFDNSYIKSSDLSITSSNGKISISNANVLSGYKISSILNNNFDASVDNQKIVINIVKDTSAVVDVDDNDKTSASDDISSTSNNTADANDSKSSVRGPIQEKNFFELFAGLIVFVSAIGVNLFSKKIK